MRGCRISKLTLANRCYNNGGVALWAHLRRQVVPRLSGGLLHEPLVMGAIMQEPQCLTMLSWRLVFQVYPDASAGRGDVLMILMKTCLIRKIRVFAL
ncbi:hypothetical protein AVEN_9383-1 [Araneus ventricosus]|uniref:Uncharacterized protein n=1 Tax=Araneus ventricosus TaxID=182803 RepID=A0A4Y2DMC5_ARAVE|nr:hypothetical protein AVEN_9383-1 [Araneus ventricosus]